MERVSAAVRVDRSAGDVRAWLHAFVPRGFALRLALRAGAFVDPDRALAGDCNVAVRLRRAPGGVQMEWEPIAGAHTGSFHGCLRQQDAGGSVLFAVDGEWNGDGDGAPHLARSIAHDVLRHLRDRACGIPAARSAV